MTTHVWKYVWHLDTSVNLFANLIEWHPFVVYSLTVEACFTYKANPASYSPKLSKQSFSLSCNPTPIGIICRGPKIPESICAYIIHTVVLECFLTAIRYAFEGEADRRKQGLPSRILFLNKSRTDQDFQSTGTLDLRGQNKRACIKTKIKLQV